MKVKEDSKFRMMQFPKKHTCPEDWRLVTCPVIGALCRNGDLIPDEDGFVTKQENFDAFLRVGISRKVAKETTDGNYDHLTLDPPRINIFEMDVVDAHKSTPDGDLTKVAKEHFRSTGVRDPLPDADLYDVLDAKAGECGRWTIPELIAAVSQFDYEQNNDHLSNDIYEPERPTGCTPADSGLPHCKSALHVSFNNTIKEFGTQTGTETQISTLDLKELVLESKYPPDFAARSPRTCYNATAGAEMGGCAACHANAIEAAVNGFNPGRVGIPFPIQRYCRCLNINKEPTDPVFRLICLPEEE
eukprot:479688-Pleurochrysis_carterae.AAC.1